MSKAADEKIDSLERELLATQEMLAFVLAALDEPVVVSKELITRGLGDGVQIVIDDDAQKNAFIFYLQESP